MAAIKIHPIAAFNDNYIWCLRRADYCVVVDPGDAEPVLSYCKNEHLTLTDILITHHHWDHTNGLASLLNRFPAARVFGPAGGHIAHITDPVKEGDSVELSNLACQFKVMTVPGHTLDHIAYYGDAGLFCGDTLFSAGCGRLFEGSPEQMYQSLQKLMQLPPATAVYCTHEYTLANIKFALAVEPANTQLQQYHQWATKQRQQNRPTLPSSIGQQLAINPFLRSTVNDVILSAQQQAGMALAEPVEVFTALRKWKDSF